MHMKKLAYATVLAAASAMFVIGSGLPSQAAAKKKAAAAEPQHMVLCSLESVPVCATKGGLKQTYANSCFAQHDNATKITNGACGAKKAAHAKKKKVAKKAKKSSKKK
jgi:hypothetical protein